MFRDGLGVHRDLAKAKLLFLSAAQKDLADAQVNLGKLHFGASHVSSIVWLIEIEHFSDRIQVLENFRPLLNTLNWPSVKEIFSKPSIISPNSTLELPIDLNNAQQPYLSIKWSLNEVIGRTKYGGKQRRRSSEVTIRWHY